MRGLGCLAQGIAMRTTDETTRRLWLVAIGCAAGIALVEIAARTATGSLLAWHPKDGSQYVDIDPWLGRIPKPGLSLRHPSGFAVSIGPHGTRSNGDASPRAERPLTLVVGDSFAFGDGVDDEDSWPAILERLSAERVINAAVPGFGLDQMILRAERLVPIYTPDRLIVSFIPHDVLRCEMSYWSGHSKPYFEIDGGTLRLRPAQQERSPVNRLKWLLSTSAAMNMAFPRFLYWEGPEEVLAHRRGGEVACLLMERLASFARAHRLEAIVLAQPQEAAAPPEQITIKDALLACAAASGLQVLDLFPRLDRLPAEHRQRLFPRHMSAEGNRLIAEAVAEFLRR